MRSITSFNPVSYILYETKFLKGHQKNLIFSIKIAIQNRCNLSLLPFLLIRLSKPQKLFGCFFDLLHDK